MAGPVTDTLTHALVGSAALPYPRDDPATLESTAARCDRVASWVEQMTGGLARESDLLRGAWEGPAASACRDEMASITSLMRSLTDPLHSCTRLLRAYAVDVTDARRQVDRLREEYDALVAGHRHDVAALLSTAGLTGSTTLTGPQRQLWAQECRLALAGDLARVRARHHDVLLDLAACAARTASRLVTVTQTILPTGPLRGRPVTDLEADIAALLPLLAESRQRAGVSSGLPAAGSPASRPLVWWSALTSDEQDRLLATWPGPLGSLDGLPATARGRANEILLDHELAVLRDIGVRTERQQRRLDTCEVVYDRLSFLRAHRDPHTDQPFEVQLLVFEPSAFGGEGRVAIAIGDVDSADHVAVMVPGLGSDVRSSLGPLTDNALRVQDRARRVSGPSSTATVAWMAYDAPELDNVAGNGAAERGADLLAADLLGWQEARDSLPHLTVIGHSYGSTTAGTSVRDHATGTDDLVLLGSPGPNAERVSELRVPPGHVYVGASSRDPVSYLDRFGADPTHRDFGAIRFQAEDVTRNSSRLDPADHSKYFEPSTESLSNIVRVVVGDYADVRPAEYRDEAWLRPDGINDDPEADREPTVAR